MGSISNFLKEIQIISATEGYEFGQSESGAILLTTKVYAQNINYVIFRAPTKINIPGCV